VSCCSSDSIFARYHGKAIFAVRGERVIIDADLARLYGVTTKRFNQAFKRNVKRFPADFAFQLSVEEFARLRSSAVTQPVDKEAGSANWSQFVTSSRRHRGAIYRPWAFTEHGALMAANVLRSAQATQMSIFLIRAFVRLREEAMANVVVLKRLAQIDKTLLQHDAGLRDVYRKLQMLLAPPPETPKRRIGF
jgi:ORF6N domain-containing protein